MKKNTTRDQSPSKTKKNPKKQCLTIGMDLGDKTSRICVLDEAGGILREDAVVS